MMKCSEQAERMSLYEYEARLWHWNDAHKAGDDVEPPDPVKAMRLLELANSDPRLTH